MHETKNYFTKPVASFKRELRNQVEFAALKNVADENYRTIFISTNLKSSRAKYAALEKFSKKKTVFSEYFLFFQLSVVST